MAENPPNLLIQSIARACDEAPLAEKWLLAPNIRVGNQWLEAVARHGGRVLNVRPKTIKRLALDLAQPALDREGLRPLDPIGALVLVDRARRTFAPGQLGYLAGMADTERLLHALHRTLLDLKAIDYGSRSTSEVTFEVAAKGHDLALLLRAYESLLHDQSRVDDTDILRMAIAQLEAGAEAGLMVSNLHLLVPDDLRHGLRGLKKRLVEAFPAGRRQKLKVDQPGDERGPREKVTLHAFRAVGEINEVREVLRRCLAESIPLDQVELLHTERAAYIPAIYETFQAQEESAAAVPKDADLPFDGLPVTFAEGIPCRHARPGRALMAWVDWIRTDCPQAAFVALIREGLIKVPHGKKEKKRGTKGCEPEPSAQRDRLADCFRAVPIGLGRDRYVRKLRQFASNMLAGEVTHHAESHAAASATIEQAEDDLGIDLDDEREDPTLEGLSREERSEAFQALEQLVAPVLALTPALGDPPRMVLKGAREFLRDWAVHRNKADNYAREKLIDAIDKLNAWLGEDERLQSLDVWSWLAALPASEPMLGTGPRPGCLHVASLGSGGHSGRAHTFIIGLNDGRFPGAGIQDPLLLDTEREKLSGELEHAAQRPERKRLAFARLLARLRGRVTLSYPCHDLVDDRELYPSPVFVAAVRANSCSEAIVSFAPEPDGEAKCRTLAEWWLWRLCDWQTSPPNEAALQSLLDRHFPDLGRGLLAARARLSDQFTEFDGRIEHPGPELDPTSPENTGVSASQLETLGRCPLQYFFKYGLRLRPPRQVAVEPDVWLSPLEAGKLLHSVFSTYVRERIQAGQPVGGEGGAARLGEILQRHVKLYEERIRPPSRDSFDRQSKQFERAIEIFLTGEEDLFQDRHNQPLYVEASLGLGHVEPGAASEQASALDSSDPVAIRVGEQTIRACGRVDRIDRVGGAASHQYSVWDYKTGGTYGYDQADPFRQGRRLQHLLYVAMVQERLRETNADSQANVESFGYFFPSDRAQGERIEWTSAALDEGRQTLEHLCQLAHTGTFPATDKDKDDCKKCDYKSVCGDVVSLAAASRTKMENAANPALEPFRALRPPKKEKAEERDDPSAQAPATPAQPEKRKPPAQR